MKELCSTRRPHIQPHLLKNPLPLLCETGSGEVKTSTERGPCSGDADYLCVPIWCHSQVSVEPIFHCAILPYLIMGVRVSNLCERMVQFADRKRELQDE
jgi:hypothetical protein